MSQEREQAIAELLRAGQQAFNDGDFERAFAALAPDVEWHFGAWMLDGGVLRGRTQVIAYYSQLRETAGSWQVETREVIEAGERCFIVHQRGRYEGRTTKIEGELESFQVWELGADGLVVRVREYATREEAVAAAEMRE